MQLHFYVSDDLGARIKGRADARGMSVSAYVAWLVSREVRSEWPRKYFESVVGGWEGPPLTRPPQGSFEERDVL